MPPVNCTQVSNVYLWRKSILSVDVKQQSAAGTQYSDDSRMIVVCMATREGLGVYPPPPHGKNFEFRYSQIPSDAIWDKLSKKYILSTIITILNFKICGGGGGGILAEGQNSRPPPLCMKPWSGNETSGLYMYVLFAHT